MGTERRKHRTQLEDVSSQRSLASGKSRTREENDLGVFLSSLPVSPGSVSQRLSGKGVVMVICADSSLPGRTGTSALVCPHW